jgi:hypothetical protein
MTTYFYFQSQKDPKQVAFTDNRDGDRLPVEDAPWVLRQEVGPEDPWHYSSPRAVVHAGVAHNGFFLLNDAPSAVASPKPVIESDRVEGTRVYDRDGNQIGTIRRLLIEKVSGRVLYVDVTFGGFLGLGTQHHTIPWEKLRYDTALGGYRTEVTEEQIRGAPAFYREDQLWPDKKEEERTLDYWRSMSM